MKETGGENLSAAYFHSTNRGKRSVEADFETEDGRALVRKLARHADVVVENFKVGGLAKYGLDAASLRAAHPRLVYCSVTGFGQTGPYAPLAGYDFMIQGMAGVMDLTGFPDGPPMKAGYATADIYCGLYAAIGILAALRRRDETGEGATLDMALMDLQVAVLGYQAINYFVSGVVPTRLGNGHPNIVPYDVFPVADGSIILAIGNDRQFARLCEALGAEDLRDDPDYAHEPGPGAQPRRAGPGARAAHHPLPARRPSRDARKAQGAGRAGELGRRRVRRCPGDRARHPRRPAGAGGEGRHDPDPALADRDRRQPMVADRPSPRLGAHTQEVLADPAWGG